MEYNAVTNKDEAVPRRLRTLSKTAGERSSTEEGIYYLRGCEKSVSQIHIWKELES